VIQIYLQEDRFGAVDSKLNEYKKQLKFPRKEAANSSVPRRAAIRGWNVFQETDSRHRVVGKRVALSVIDAESAALFSRDGLSTQIVAGEVAILEPFDTAVTVVVFRPAIFHPEWAKVKTRDRAGIAIQNRVSDVNQTGNN
jgi:hypothetical protein